MTNNKSVQEESLEKALEQGGSNAKAKMMSQMTQGGKGATPGATKGGAQSSGINTLSSLADPDAWVKDLYGLPQTYAKDAASKAFEQGKSGKDKNHTPLDTKKLEGKYNGQDISPQQRQFFKKYQQEYEQFLEQKKKKEQDAKRKEEEEEKRKREELQKRKEQEEQSQATPQGKVRKSILGQGRRKATTELYPETKAGGAK